MHKDSPCKCNQLLPVLIWHNSKAVTGHKQRHRLLMIHNTLPWGPSPKASHSHLSRVSPLPPEAAFLPVAPHEAPLPVRDIPLSAELGKMDVLQLPKKKIPSGMSSLPTQVFQRKSHPLVTKRLWGGTCICSGPKALARYSPSGKKKGLIYCCALGNHDSSSIPHSPRLPLYYSMFSLLPNEPSRDLQV